MTAYGLLTYTLLGDVASALPVVKWLSQQRNSLGGFSSTQVGVALCLQGLFQKPIQTTASGFNSKYIIHEIAECHPFFCAFRAMEPRSSFRGSYFIGDLLWFQCVLKPMFSTHPMIYFYYSC